VDPYYLTHKAQEVGYHPEVILAGRRINDGMARHVADETVKLMLRKNLPVLGSKVLVLGLTFKENCPDPRHVDYADLRENQKYKYKQLDSITGILTIHTFDIGEETTKEHLKYKQFHLLFLLDWEKIQVFLLI
jgi:UDP-N-acetyl-D-mannosaminuronate dehydrogenase